MTRALSVLALEPYYGGSHRAFLDGWTSSSRHKWTLLTLPPRKWKWRMRHSAITLAKQTNEKIREGEKWDVLFCSDMLNLAEYIGLTHSTVQKIPSISYFHENQLTYPTEHHQEYDFQYALTNMTTALASTEVWFNSSFHRDSFLNALHGFLKRMPDFRPMEAIESIHHKSRIAHPGINQFPKREERLPGPMRIIWAARWEYDKNPGLLFESLRILKQSSIKFRISVVGEQFRDAPEVFHTARKEFTDFIDCWGYQQHRHDYEKALLEADVLVSTADHEFFGISVIEAAAAGAFPLVPKRLAYPETLELNAGNEDFYYEGGADELAKRLIQLSEKLKHNNLWNGGPNRPIRIAEKFYWKTKAGLFDEDLNNIIERQK